jgi:ergothioneine biosynthesis protein EgtB
VKLLQRFNQIRNRTEEICAPLTIEDMVVQPVAEVSPPKWHMAHSTWFFETFFLKKTDPSFKGFDPDFGFLFNSYYNSVGSRTLRTDRGNVTRPGVEKILEYRHFINDHVGKALENHEVEKELLDVFEIGLNHEMQHQELLLSDLKYILGHNPIFPVYKKGTGIDEIENLNQSGFVSIDEGVYPIGFEGDGFKFDNELGRHKQYLHAFEIATNLVTIGEFIEFIEAGAYSDFRFWHSDAWAWINDNDLKAPMYFHKIDGAWHRYTLGGLQPIDPSDVMVHVNYYEAAAFASWKGMRLPTEFEWEAAADQLSWGHCWEWTNSAYLPYPGFEIAPGALGEYNGKFMVNQMVLRGASRATHAEQKRRSYRNFFHPQLQWQYAGIRLAR